MYNTLYIIAYASMLLRKSRHSYVMNSQRLLTNPT